MIHAESNESRLDMTAMTVHDEKTAGRRGGGSRVGSAGLKDAFEPVVCERVIRPTGI